MNPNQQRWVVVAAVWTFGMVWLPAGAAAALIDVVDQQQTQTPQQFYNVSASANLPLGQEFTPSLPAVGFVELLVSDAGTGTGPGANLQVRVRAGDITGTILGTTNTAFVPDGTNTGVPSTIYTRFTFPAPVPLTPGSLYVLEPVQLGPIGTGNNNFGIVGRTSSGSYAGGRAIISGAPQPNVDFNFREGTTVPEPAFAATAVVLAAGLLARRRTDRRPIA